ncbi:MAG: 3-hydroxyacyl-CoA dehydrogenase NAD-binding domain-containing protein, partial [Candidatus Binatota bacterium]
MKEGIKNVGVVGLGVMGFDIAFLYAMRGYRTLAYDASNAVMEFFTDRREKTIERLKRRERISDSEAENVRQGLKVSPEFQSMETLDFVTEAVSEVAKTKLSVYTALREIGFTGILTTNTSSLPRDALLAGDSYERKKFATTHFFNPVLYTQMVEVVEGDMEESSFNSTLSFLRSLGRNPVQTRDISGVVSNGILMY